MRNLKNAHIGLFPTGTIRPTIMVAFLSDEGIPINIPQKIWDVLNVYFLYNECFFEKHEVIIKIIGWRELQLIEKDPDYIDGIIESLTEDKLVWFFANEYILGKLKDLLEIKIPPEEIYYHHSQPGDLCKQIVVTSLGLKKFKLVEVKKENILSYN